MGGYSVFEIVLFNQQLGPNLRFLLNSLSGIKRFTFRLVIQPHTFKYGILPVSPLTKGPGPKEGSLDGKTPTEQQLKIFQAIFRNFDKDLFQRGKQRMAYN